MLIITFSYEKRFMRVFMLMCCKPIMNVNPIRNICSRIIFNNKRYQINLKLIACIFRFKVLIADSYFSAVYTECTNVAEV
jgi:hypothetical protein